MFEGSETSKKDWREHRTVEWKLTTRSESLITLRWHLLYDNIITQNMHIIVILYM